MHVLLVRARLRDQDLDVERAFFVSDRVFYREPDNANVRVRAKRARRVRGTLQETPMDLAGPTPGETRSIGRRARSGFPAGRFRDFTTSRMRSARVSRREREKRKKRERREGQRKRQAEMRG